MIKKITAMSSDKKFNIVALAIFLPLAAILKIYFFLR